MPMISDASDFVQAQKSPGIVLFIFEGLNLAKKQNKPESAKSLFSS